MSFTQSLIERTELFNKQIKELSFTYDGYVYNPLDYAWDMLDLVQKSCFWV